MHQEEIKEAAAFARAVFLAVGKELPATSSEAVATLAAAIINSAAINNSLEQHARTVSP